MFWESKSIGQSVKEEKLMTDTLSRLYLMKSFRAKKWVLQFRAAVTHSSEFI